MSTLADRLAAALAPLTSETKTALARLLMAQAGVPERKPRKGRKMDLLLDTRTVAELWLAGEDHTARNRAIAKAEKAGEYRSILVTFADGYALRTGSFMRDDGHAKAAAVRFARAQAMERGFTNAREAWLAECREMRKSWVEVGISSKEPDYPPEPESSSDGWQWVTLPDATMRRTRACAVPEVASVEFVPMAPAPQLVQVGTAFVIADGDFCPVDHLELARRARALRAKVGAYPLPVPVERAPRTVLEAVGAPRVLAWSVPLLEAVASPVVALRPNTRRSRPAWRAKLKVAA